MRLARLLSLASRLLDAVLLAGVGLVLACVALIVIGPLAGHPVLVAVDAEVVVGWATYGDFRDTGRWPGYRFTVEHSVHVAESHWGRGVGRALMVALVETARRAGKRVMVAAIDAGNVGSIEFHARLGFVEVGRMPGVGDKWGQRLDLVLMQLDLSRPLG